MSEPPAGAERRQRLLQLGSAAAFLAVVAVAVLIVVSESQTSGGDTELESSAEVARELRGIPQRGMMLGQPQAPVTLIEFGDLQCPACKAYAEEALPGLIASKVRRGAAKLVFRNNAILGEDSEIAARAALAAGEQDRGWSFVTLFYANQGFEGSDYVTDAFLTAIARAAGVSDIKRWNGDRHSQRLVRQSSREARQAERLGFASTPSFAIKGSATDGVEPLGLAGSAGELEAAVERASRPK